MSLTLFGAAALALAILTGSASAFTISDQPAPARVIGDHDPNDLRMAGAVPWDTLRELDLAFDSPLPGQTSTTMGFTSAVQQLDGTEVKLVGFLYPLEAAAEHTHFLLSAFPPACPFCLPGGPADLVEINAAEAVAFSYDPVVVTGRFALLHDDPSGLVYRLTDARPVR